MLIVLWILNAVLALAFLGSGGLKIVRSREALASTRLGWATDFSVASVKLIGLVEVVGAVGLILPLLLDTAKVLSPLAAIGLFVIMIGAVVVHVRRHEAPTPAVILAVLSAASAVIGFVVLV